MKRTLATLMALCMMLSLAACGGSGASSVPASVSASAPSSGSEPAPADGAVLNIWCWNDEFQSRFNDYYPEVKAVAEDKSTTTLNDGTIVKWTINPNENNNYQNKLDEAPAGAGFRRSRRQDRYFPHRSGLRAEVCGFRLHAGRTRRYRPDGRRPVRAVPVHPGHRHGRRQAEGRHLAGHPRPVRLPAQHRQRRTGHRRPRSGARRPCPDWDKFNAVAEQAAAKGYKMLSGYDDSYRTFSNNVSAPRVTGTTVTVDENLMKWVEQTKTYTDNGYNNKSSLWSDVWAADQGPDGKVFGFFYSTWGINFTLLGNSLETPEAEGGKAEAGNGIYGDYAVCEGPQPYYWGGTWICAAAGTDNTAAIADIMRSLTCDKAIMKQITEDTQDYTNNAPAMEELASSDFKSDFLGGQNHIALFAAAAPNIDMSNAGPYDQGLNESFQGAFKDYFDGAVDLETAKTNFQTSIGEKYPELTEVVWPE